MPEKYFQFKKKIKGCVKIFSDASLTGYLDALTLSFNLSYVYFNDKSKTFKGTGKF